MRRRCKEESRREGGRGCDAIAAFVIGFVDLFFFRCAARERSWMRCRYRMKKKGGNEEEKLKH